MILELDPTLKPEAINPIIADRNHINVLSHIDTKRVQELDPRRQIHMYDSAPDVVYHAGLFNYLALCWRMHYGVVLTPDMLWHAILAEMTVVIKKEPDMWAHLFTTDPTKKQHLIVMTGKVEEIDPVAVVALLENKVPTDTATFLPKFSTTTDNSHLARCIAFCDMVSPWYSYGTLLCGIPFIDIRGDIEDWSLIAFNLGAMTRMSVTRNMTDFLHRCVCVVAKIMDTLSGEKRDWDKMISLQKCGSGSQYELSGWITSLIYNNPKRPVQLEGLPAQICSMAYINHDTNRRFKLYGGLIQSRIEGAALVPDYGFARVEQFDKEPTYVQEPEKVEFKLYSTPVVATQKKLDAQWTFEEQPSQALHSLTAEELLKTTLNNNVDDVQDERSV